MRRILVTGLFAGLAVGCGDTPVESMPATEAALDRTAAIQSSAQSEASVEAAYRSYEVTVYNLTGGQPFTPPLAVTHRRPADLFSTGDAASFELKEIAENGNLGPMLEALGGDKHVSMTAVALGDPPPILPGAYRTFEINAGPGAKWFSWVSMLICTNDGFTGADSFRLPKRVGDETEAYTSAYDAGTEVNTEDFYDLVPPCAPLTGVETDKMGVGASNPDLAEGGVIRMHPGVYGNGDLSPEIHGWENPVAKIVIRRVG